MGNYIGRDVPYGQFDTQVLTPNSVLTTFNLTYKISSAASVIVVLAGSILQPNVQYSLSNGGTQIVFAVAPTTGSSLYITYLGRELGVVPDLKFENGTAAAPSITFFSDVNTGIFRVSEDQLGFTTNGIERARIKSGGQLRFIPLSSVPVGAEAGDVYYNSGDNKLKVYNGTNWIDLN